MDCEYDLATQLTLAIKYFTFLTCGGVKGRGKDGGELP
jgi:hypothetical protein